MVDSQLLSILESLTEGEQKVLLAFADCLKARPDRTSDPMEFLHGNPALKRLLER